ncbi:MAG: hypothetical protein ACYC6M_04600 [Terriglobales bacterium]
MSTAPLPNRSGRQVLAQALRPVPRHWRAGWERALQRADWLNSPAPDVAIEISATAVLALGGGRQRARAASRRELPTGVLEPSAVAPNARDPERLVAALQQVLTGVGGVGREVVLLVPDATARVSLLDFEQLPADPDELRQLVRFRMRKILPFDVEHAALDCQVVTGTEVSQVLVTVADRARLDEYENALEAAGARAAVVLPAGLGALEGTPPGHLLLKGDARTLTAAFAPEGRLVFYRVVEGAHGALCYADLHPSLVLFRDWWETMRGTSATARVTVSGLEPELMFEAGAENPWAEVAWAAPDATATGTPAETSRFLAVAGALGARA